MASVIAAAALGVFSPGATAASGSTAASSPGVTSAATGNTIPDANGALLVGCPVAWATADLFNVPTSLLQACGFTIYPLVATNVLPDMETDYVYDQGGGTTTTIRVPPASFDPATATSEEDQMYGLGPPPLSSGASPEANAQAEAGYAAQLSTVKSFGPAPPYLIGTPLSNGTYGSAGNEIWSGYEMTGSSSFNYAYVSYNEPQDGYTACNKASVAFWDGIAQNTIAQDGTGQGYGWGSDAIWYEVIPGIPTSQSTIVGYTSPTVRQYMSTIYLGNDTFQFDMQSGNHMIIDDRTMSGTPNLTNDDDIVERPDTGSGAGNTPLLNYNYVTMTGYAEDGGGVFGITGTPGVYYNLEMVGQDHGDEMAGASGVQSDGATFVDTHYSCAW